MKAVLFDLDDTLVDHQFSRRCGLSVLQRKYPALQRCAIEELEKEHEQLSAGNYRRLLDGSLSLQDAMVERIFLLCRNHGIFLGREEAVEATNTYREAYERNRRPVPGAVELLCSLKGSVVTGVVTNGLVGMQMEKVRHCGLEDLLDFVLVSGEFGVHKPERGIFEEALRRAGVRPKETVFVGDSWDTDILGAICCGMRAVWLNRYGYTCPASGIAAEIHALEPLEDVLSIIIPEMGYGSMGSLSSMD